MRTYKLLTIAGIAALGVAGAVIADGHASPEITKAIEDRQAHMKGYGKAMGVLGKMAKGEVDYDAAAAQQAADDLAMLASADQSTYWPEGSDTSIKGSRALPIIWQEAPKVMAIGQDLATAAEAMKAAAGTDLAALRGAIGQVGAACSACHEKYRQPKN